VARPGGTLASKWTENHDMADASVAYLHFLGMMCLLAALVGEHLLLGGDLDSKRTRQLVNTDLVYRIAVAVVLVTGLLRLTFFGKGIAFYTGSALFHAKMGLFVAVVALSLYPTKCFREMRRELRDGAASRLGVAHRRRLTMFVRAELASLVLIPSFAVLMGRGFGY
jgi:putative membrane protein